MTVSAILLDADYPLLKSYVLTHTGLSYFADKDEDLAYRLARRVTSRNASSCGEYLAMLTDRSTGVRETEALVGELTIGETYFFRHRENFDLLRDTVFPDLLERNRHTQRLRIWSAGCATGAEPYSIALLLRLELAAHIAGWDISILATDLNRNFLAQACEALFSKWAFREMPAEIKSGCFREEGTQWRLLPEFRKWVRFEYHNLASPMPPPTLDGVPFDLIVCRNVLIYFSRDLIRTTASQFHESLAPGGWLLVGHAEPNAETFRDFQVVSTSNGMIYRKPVLNDAQPQHAIWHDWARNPIGDESSHSPLAVVAPRVRAQTLVADAVRTPQATIQEARALADRGQQEEAMALCQRLIEANSLDPEAHFTLALAQEHSGLNTEAQEALRRAIYLDRRLMLAHYHLGACLQNTQDYPAAAKSFRNVLRLLSEKPQDEIVQHGDGMNVADLRELTKMHLESIGEP